MLTLLVNLSRWAPVALALVGGTIGLGMVSFFPPRHPDDKLFAITIAGGGLAALGLLIGLLASLCLRRRINLALALSGLAIPFACFGWFFFGKGGNWDAAGWFAIVGWIAVVIFLVNTVTMLVQNEKVS